MRFIVNNGKEEHPFEIQPGVSIVGRDRMCDLRVQSGMISRRHMECYREGSAVRIRDLGSSNGTLVNGTRIARPVVLQDGDEVRLGDIRLVFEASAGGAPAAAVFAAAGEPSAARPVALEPDEPIVASVEVLEPSGNADDHTPPDGSFVPEVYRPDAGKPILTQRDGKWFLRDPRTNREVEIVPKGSSAAAAGQDKRNKLIAWCVLGGTSLLAVLIVALAVMSWLGQDTKPVHKYSDAEYKAVIDKSIKAFETGKTADAVQALKDIHDDRPELKMAGAVLEVVRNLDKAGADLTEMDTDTYNTLDKLLQDLEQRPYYSSLSAKVAMWRNKIDVAQNEISILNEAKRFEANKEYAKAYEKANKLQAERPIRQKNAEYIRGLEEKARMHYVSQGDHKKTEGKWDEAIAFYQQAVKYAPTVYHVKEITERESECRRIMADQKHYAGAEASFNDGRFSETLALLDKIDPKSPLAKDAAELRKDVHFEQARERVLMLYANGSALEAVKIIREQQLDETQAMHQLREKAIAVHRAFDEANAAAEKEGNTSEAIRAFQRVLDLESDKKNYYHSIAAKRLQMLDNPTLLAAEYLKKGNDAFGAGDMVAARRFWNEAFATDRKSGAASLAMLDKEANKRYLEAKAYFSKGELAQAIDFYKMAMKYAEPGTDVYNKAHNEMREAQTKLKSIESKPPPPPEEE
ncbi:MAG TPA: FHA domain-containing protein [Planctomycetota bacterium]|nr:FHA domain-containing protein [Planctomycetota bacterium]